MTAVVNAAAGPDFRLVLSVLEKKVIAGQEPEKCRAVLRRADIWRGLPPDLALKWAETAQMAGDIDTALAVLERLNRTRPDLEVAWRMRTEILNFTDRREELARVAALRRRTGTAPPSEAPPPAPKTADADLAAVGAPFAALRRRQSRVARYMALFSGREDAFARQWADKAKATQGYAPVRRPLTVEDVEAHLSGRQTYGIYLLRSDASVSAAVLDVDLNKEFRGKRLKADLVHKIRREQAYLIQRVTELSAARGAAPLLEFSGGKGFHFWYFFAAPVPAAAARNLTAAVAREIAPDVSAFNLEAFPKQARLTGKGFGNLVKLPLGVHRLSGKPSFFPACKDRTLAAQLAFLETARPVDPATVDFRAPETRAEVVVHPGFQAAGKRKIRLDPPAELKTLSDACPPVAQVVAACMAGRLSPKEEKVLFQTVGFLPGAKQTLHGVMAALPDYNPHKVDYQLSRLRGTPLGCRRIHRLLAYDGPTCAFENPGTYEHPLRHLGGVGDPEAPVSEKIENLDGAIRNLKTAIRQVERFLP